MPKNMESRLASAFRDPREEAEERRRRRLKEKKKEDDEREERERRKRKQREKRQHKRDREELERRVREIEERGGIFRMAEGDVQATSTGPLGAVVETQDTLKPARPGQSGAYTFNEDNPTGRQPIVVYGTKEQIKETLKKEHQRPVKNNIGEDPKLYMSVKQDRLGAYDVRNAKQALFPAQDTVMLLRDNALIAGMDAGLGGLNNQPDIAGSRVRDYATIAHGGLKDAPGGVGKKDALNAAKDAYKARKEGKSETKYLVIISPLPGEGSVEVGHKGEATFGDFNKALHRKDGWADEGGMPFDPGNDFDYIDDSDGEL